MTHVVIISTDYTCKTCQLLIPLLHVCITTKVTMIVVMIEYNNATFKTTSSGGQLTLEAILATPVVAGVFIGTFLEIKVPL